MTKDEFWHETYEFVTHSGQEAKAKAAEYNARGVDGDTIVAVQIGDQWCVMLRTAWRFVTLITVESKAWP